MDTQTFLASLEPHRARPLIFDLGGQRVSPDYHVTEVKAVSVQAMDCGGRGDAWQETVVQLWTPGGGGAAYMHVDKFLDIYRRVAAHVPIADGGELRVEYGDVGAPAISYLVSYIQVEEDALVVTLSAPGVSCKVIRTPGLPVLNASCCAPTMNETANETETCCG